MADFGDVPHMEQTGVVDRYIRGIPVPIVNSLCVFAQALELLAVLEQRNLDRFTESNLEITIG